MLTLRAGRSSLVVAPEHGAAIAGWLLGATPLLPRTRPEAAAGGDSHAMGCFPLLPYANRIARGRFPWQGAQHALRLNFGDHPNSIHGVGWQRPWTLAQATPGSATMMLEHRPNPDRPNQDWPFPFSASLAYTLTHSGLTVDLSLINRHDGPAPAGLGLHPYFPKANDAALRFHATGVWRNGADALPETHGALPEDWRHDTPRPVAASRLDNCFTGWDQRADILAGPASLRIEASSVFRHLQVFTPSWADFFCAEPVTHVPDALNRPDLPADQGMTVLQPDETLSGTVRFLPTAAPMD